jgi:hypothetical protein
LPEDVDLSKFVHYGKKTTRLGNRPIKEATSTNYEGQYRQIWRYCAMRGKYESMLMLLSPVPKNVPSMEVSVCEEFGRFKRNEPNSPHMSTDGSTQLKDVFGLPMTSDGGWNNPKIMEHFKAAIGDLHVANDRGGQYMEPCDDCLALPSGERYKGCAHHAGHPRVIRNGNPTSNQIFLNMKIEMVNLAEEAGYEEEGSSQYLPSDLRRLRTNLLSSGSIVDLQTWTIVILACREAWRHDDYHLLTMESLLPKFFQIRQEQISALAIKVKGKSDTSKIKQKIHADHETPDLCPVRALLIYMHILGIQDGYLFPSEQELFDPPADGHYKTMVDYSNFLKSFKELSDRILPPRDGLKTGCQTFRKTFYVLAVFGGGEQADVQMSARHASQKQSLKYRKDAMSLFTHHQENPNPADNVSKWKPIHIDGSGGNAALMNLQAGYLEMTAASVAPFYIRNMLGVKATNPLQTSIPFLFDVAMKHGMDRLDPDEAIQAWIGKNIHPDKVETLNTLIGAVVTKQVKRIVKQSDESLLLARSVAAIPVPPVLVPDVKAPTAKKQKVENDLQARHGLGSMDARKKLETMTTLWNDKPNWQKPLTSGAKSFSVKHLAPAMNCLEGHFGGSIDAFLKQYPSFQHTTFPKKHCGGRGSCCVPKN